MKSPVLATWMGLGVLLCALPARAQDDTGLEDDPAQDDFGEVDAASAALDDEPEDASPAPAQDSPPVPVQASAPEEPKAPRRRGGLGIAVGTAQTGDLIVPVKDEPIAVRLEDEWTFKFNGFLRVPLRVGFGTAATSTAMDTGDLPGKVHVPPQIPDGTFTDWQYTGNLPGPWTELRFSYGNSRVSANVQIGAYNVSDAGYRNLQAQLGINEAYVQIDASDLFGADGGLIWTVGGFSNRYGGAGKYDAGKYDTYLFGRTHIAGETLTVFYDLTPDLQLTVEHGIGAKLEPAPLVPGLPEPQPAYLPYPGPVQQGATLVHHAHAGVTYDEAVTLALHYMTTWTDDARLDSEVDGRITTLGAELRLDAGIYGLGFFGFSHLSSEDPLRVAPSLEVLHANGGWNLRDNFFGNATAGNGTVDTLMWQYTYSFATLMHHPNEFWGQSPDLLLTVFGMLNFVDGTDPEFAEAEQKLKVGGEATYTALSWLAGSLRFDLVQPNMDDSTQSFSVISPALLVRTGFLAHEQIMLQYSHYFYGDNVRTAWPAGGLAPDDDVLMISASMWW